MSPPLSLPAAVVLLACLLAALTDLWKFRVYNLLTLPLLFSGILYHSFTEGADGLAASSLGALFGLGVLLPFCLLGGMGAGDVKLLAGVGAWLGLPATFVVFLLSGLAGCFVAVPLIITYGWVVRPVRACHPPIMSHASTPVQGMPPDYPTAEPDDQVAMAIRCADRRWHLIPFSAMMAIGFLALLVWAWLWGR